MNSRDTAKTILQGGKRSTSAQITAEFGPALGTLENCLGGSFNKEYRLV